MEAKIERKEERERGKGEGAEKEGREGTQMTSGSL